MLRDGIAQLAASALSAAVALGLGLAQPAGGERPAPQMQPEKPEMPMQPGKPPIDMMAMMGDCMAECRAMSESIDAAARALDEAERGADAETRAAIGRAQERIADAKARCTAMMGMMDQMRGGMEGMSCPMCGAMINEGRQQGSPVLPSLPEQTGRAVGDILESYFRIGDRLAADSAEGVRQPAQRIAEEAGRLAAAPIPDRPRFWEGRSEDDAVRDRARAMAEAEGVDEARERYAALSETVRRLVLVTGVPRTVEGKVELLTCPMYPEDKGGAAWLQQGGSTRNPYMGAAMPGCFGERQQVPPAGADAGSTGKR